jgi:aspartyl/asparaginyl beta-hydroxylase (cupin superfamily)
VRHGDVYDVSFDATLTLVFPGTSTDKFHEIGTDSWQKRKGKWLIIKTLDTLAEQTSPE